MIVAGILCAVVVPGGAGPVVAIVLVGLGLIAVLSLIFLEVGLSEDRSRAGEERARALAAERQRQHHRARPIGSPPKRSESRTPMRLERRRGGRRRLR